MQSCLSVRDGKYKYLLFESEVLLCQKLEPLKNMVEVVLIACIIVCVVCIGTSGAVVYIFWSRLRELRRADRDRSQSSAEGVATATTHVVVSQPVGAVASPSPVRPTLAQSTQTDGSIIVLFDDEGMEMSRVSCQAPAAVPRLQSTETISLGDAPMSLPDTARTPVREMGNARNPNNISNRYSVAEPQQKEHGESAFKTPRTRRAPHGASAGCWLVGPTELTLYHSTKKDQEEQRSRCSTPTVTVSSVECLSYPSFSLDRPDMPDSAVPVVVVGSHNPPYE